MFNVREPWPSLTTGTSLVSGQLEGSDALTVTSRMPDGGVIFGDDMQEDYLQFTSEVAARIGIADARLQLVLA